MNTQEAGLILRSGDAYMLKKFFDTHAAKDPRMAASIYQTLARDVGRGRNSCQLMTAIGFFTLIFIVGIPLLIGGLVQLSRINNAQRVLDQGYAMWRTENP